MTPQTYVQITNTHGERQKICPTSNQSSTFHPRIAHVIIVHFKSHVRTVSVSSLWHKMLNFPPGSKGVNNNNTKKNVNSGRGGRHRPFLRQTAMRRLARCAPGERTARRVTTATEREAATTTTTVPGRALVSFRIPRVMRASTHTRRHPC